MVSTGPVCLTLQTHCPDQVPILGSFCSFQCHCLFLFFFSLFPSVWFGGVLPNCSFPCPQENFGFSLIFFSLRSGLPFHFVWEAWLKKRYSTDRAERQMKKKGWYFCRRGIEEENGENATFDNSPTPKYCIYGSYFRFCFWFLMQSSVVCFSKQCIIPTRSTNKNRHISKDAEEISHGQNQRDSTIHASKTLPSNRNFCDDKMFYGCAIQWGSQ